MKKSKIKNLLLLALLSLIASCNNDPISTEETSTVREKDYYLKLGKKLENPYSVKNMKRALDSVKAKMTISKTAKSTSDFDIETSHLYVKIEPKNATEEALVKKDTSQNFFDYPLDYDFSEEVLKEIGTNNPDIIGSYYVAVPKDYVFPEGIKTEVLEELYIPEQDPYFDNATETGKVSKSTISSKEDLLGNLLIEAFKLTHNEAQLGLQSTTTGKSSWWIFGKRWRPNGKITMFDNSLGRDVPVEGAQVLIRQWFTVDSGITDVNGNFSTGTVRGEARYILQWERQHYDIRNDTFGQAETRGPSKKNESWTFNITNPKDIHFAMVHRAAHHYYYKDIKGLRRPPFDGEMPTRTKIAAIDKTDKGFYGDFSFWRGLGGILPNIRIYQRDNCQDYYGTTIHELAHSSHWKMAWWTFQTVDERVAESWARGVQWELTRMVYPNYGNIYFGTYTGVVEDMIDSDNSFGDNVSGYTIRQIENSLMYQKNWEDWRNKIINDYDNPTENNLPALFTRWN
ncbi:hypothetical protein ACHRVK_22020 [Flavobacterium plurextorum]|jgi:hypothetical protein|uniref:hypothetical protein n=1 Tax=Flavobacterium plurextorum TaxID=1114867 RepID=UPI0037576E48